MDYSARPPRGRSRRPTRAEVFSAWAHIREAAATGDLQACGLVIQLADNSAPQDEEETGSEMFAAGAMLAIGCWDGLTGKSPAFVAAAREIAEALTNRISELE
jgi:hypothetical protein